MAQLTMLGEMIRSWKYPERLVIVNLVPTGFLFFFGFLAPSPPITTWTSTPPVRSAVSNGVRSNCRSALGVFTLSLSDLSASDRPSFTVSLSSSESDGSEVVSSPPGKSFSATGVVTFGADSQLATLVDIDRGRLLVQVDLFGDNGF